MKNCNICLLMFLFLIILILLLCIRFQSYTTEKFYSQNKFTEPCTQQKFDEKLKKFYKISKKYRDYEKKMNKARNEYDKNYNLLITESRALESSKNELDNCIRY